MLSDPTNIPENVLEQKNNAAQAENNSSRAILQRISPSQPASIIAISVSGNLPLTPSDFSRIEHFYRTVMAFVKPVANLIKAANGDISYIQQRPRGP